jgi:hypothetical protein
MGVGALVKDGFERVMGLRVQGWIGWLLTMLWTNPVGHVHGE